MDNHTTHSIRAIELLDGPRFNHHEQNWSFRVRVLVSKDAPANQRDFRARIHLPGSTQIAYDDLCRPTRRQFSPPTKEEIRDHLIAIRKKASVFAGLQGPQLVLSR